MKQVRFIVEQIEESKKLIKNGDIPNFRMAFVLLDNAAEILMYRSATQELIHNGFYRRMRESSTRGLNPEQIKKFESEVRLPAIIDVKRERLIERFFGEKSRFLSEDKSYFPKTTASVLRSLHKYRNELYHNDFVREETVRACVILLFEIVCDLLRVLTPSSYSIHPPDYYNTPGWQRFFKEYKISKPYMLGDKIWQKISKQLKYGIAISFGDLRDVLEVHLLTRIDEAIQNIEFVMKDGLGIEDEERALKHIQFVASGKTIGMKNADKLLKKFKAKHSMKNFEKWRKQIEKFKKVKNKIKLFEMYSEVERQFEQLESQITHAAMELDRAIQHAVDLARGK